MKITLSFLLSVLLFVGCSKEPKDVSINRFSDPKLQKIYSLQDQQETQKLIPLLRAKKPEHREAAVLAFASIQDPSAVQFLRQSMFTDQDKRVRIAAAYSIGQLRDSLNVGLLFMAFEKEIFPEVKKVILAALGKSANAKVVEYLNKFNSHITALAEGHTRAMYASIGVGQVGDSFAKNALRYFHPKASKETKFYAASLISRMPMEKLVQLKPNILLKADKETDNEIKRLLSTPWKSRTKGENAISFDSLLNASQLESNPYDFSTQLRNTDLTFPGALDSLKRWAFSARYQIVRTTAAELYLASAKKEDEALDGSFIQDCIRSRDMALQSLACYEIIANPSEFWVPILETYRDSLAMPRQLETIIDFDKALAASKDETYTPPITPQRRPMDWAHIATIPENQQVVVETTQGAIVLDLFVNEAPASVSNFLKLVEDSFYDGKYFHRVVPNFVIQGGCPRGDGWGSLDWTQRSEFSNYLSYKTGTLGLASAGKDTEGVQFFITHNPTPFLDGRYTIFGRVNSGMNVVGKIKVGDRIIKIRKK